jgi:RecA-family ATPase
MNKNTLGTLASQLSIPSEDEILRDELQAYADQNNKQRKVTQHGVMGDAVAIVDQTWIWDSYIPAAYTLVTGTAGSQKSWLLCELAATVSAGRNWPDGTACTQHGVIVISGEDSQSTLAGRMRNCGADLSKSLVSGHGKNQ